MWAEVKQFLRANFLYFNIAFVVFIIYTKCGKKKEEEKKEDCKHKGPKVDYFSKVLSWIETNIPGGAFLIVSFKNFLIYLFYRPNPIIQLLYLLVAGGGFVVYVSVGFVEYCPGPYLASYHKVTGSIVMFICYFSFYKACVTDPGFLKDDKQVKIAKKKFKFDEVMYKKEN